MKSSAKTVKEYLASLPEDRRAAIEAVRKVIRANLDKDYEECMLYGMIGYAVPHRVWPLGYHCDPSKPLMMAALASQKNNLTVYLMSVYGDQATREWFVNAWARTGKKLDMGGGCIRFKKLEDAALDVIGETIRRLPARLYIENYVRLLASTGRGPDGKKLKGEKPATKAATPVATKAKEKDAKPDAKKAGTKAAKSEARRVATPVAKKTTTKPAKKAGKKIARKTAKESATRTARA
jgi:hypothetical protein